MNKLNANEICIKLNKLLDLYRYSNASYTDFEDIIQGISSEIYINLVIDHGTMELSFRAERVNWCAKAYDLRIPDNKDYVIKILRDKYCTYKGEKYMVHKNVLQYNRGYALKYMIEYDCLPQYKDIYRDSYNEDLEYWKSIINLGPECAFYDDAVKILNSI
jgi:hypothetical protein